MSSAVLRRALFTRLPAATRPLSTSTILNKTVTETVKDTVHTIDLKAGQTLAAGIDKAEQATESVKEAVGAAQKNAPSSADEAAGMAKEKAYEAKGKAQETKGEIKGKASEMSGKAKGAYQEAKSGA
ncbi:hypothetical protein Dda_7263 [Drechslerella dactyloides]|uniref:LEA domain protein n=1 Tax=Drechslerella dactyloides TaxID=74499 RepID=A0AAD6IRU8_DREDA|nr:hypothetical protein Dda_7263 [Drechslerella dactyloides]